MVDQRVRLALVDDIHPRIDRRIEVHPVIAIGRGYSSEALRRLAAVQQRLVDAGLNDPPLQVKSVTLAGRLDPIDFERACRSSAESCRSSAAAVAQGWWGGFGTDAALGAVADGEDRRERAEEPRTSFVCDKAEAGRTEATVATAVHSSAIVRELEKRQAQRSCRGPRANRRQGAPRRHRQRRCQGSSPTNLVPLRTVRGWSLCRSDQAPL